MKKNNNLVPISAITRLLRAINVQPKEPTVEIARSFSFKLNVGNYESRDFFCSQKAECKASEAEQVSAALYAFCKNEVLKSVNQFKTVDTKKSNDVGRDSAQHEAGDL